MLIPGGTARTVRCAFDRALTFPWEKLFIFSPIESEMSCNICNIFNNCVYVLLYITITIPVVAATAVTGVF